MKYYNNSFHDCKVRTDEKTNECYAKDYGSDVEYALDYTSKKVTDAIIAKDEISEEEYYS